MLDFDKCKKNILELIKTCEFSDKGFFSLPQISEYGYTKQTFLIILNSLSIEGFLSDIYDHNLELWAPNDAYELNMVAIEFNISKDFDNLYKKIFEISENKNINNLPSKIKLPTNTKWSDVIIKWINGNDVEVTLKNDKKFKEILDYKELGFYDKKSKKPNINWNILTTLAMNSGQMRWDNLGGNSDQERWRKINAFQKRISELSKALKNVFLIDDNPFDASSGDKKYYIKINLEPEGNENKTKKNDCKYAIPDEKLAKYEEMSKKDFINNLNNEENQEKEYLGSY